jgi:hypothetical protein
VPEGGTKALLDKPRKEIPPGTKGPNGGTVEVIGEHIVEVVIDEETDDLRVYFLNDKLEVIDVPEGRRFELNIEGRGCPLRRGGNMRARLFFIAAVSAAITLLSVLRAGPGGGGDREGEGEGGGVRAPSWS